MHISAMRLARVQPLKRLEESLKLGRFDGSASVITAEPRPLPSFAADRYLDTTTFDVVSDAFVDKVRRTLIGHDSVDQPPREEPLEQRMTSSLVRPSAGSWKSHANDCRPVERSVRLAVTPTSDRALGVVLEADEGARRLRPPAFNSEQAGNDVCRRPLAWAYGDY